MISDGKDDIAHTQTEDDAAEIECRRRTGHRDHQAQRRGLAGERRCGDEALIEMVEHRAHHEAPPCSRHAGADERGRGAGAPEQRQQVDHLVHHHADLSRYRQRERSRNRPEPFVAQSLAAADPRLFFSPAC